MKQKIKKVVSLFMLLSLAVCCLTACGSASTAYDSVIESPKAEANGSLGFYGDTSAIPENVEVSEVNISQKLIYTSSMTIETKEYDAAALAIRNAVISLGGYIEDTYSHSYASSRRNSFYNTRIPVATYHEFLNALCDVGNITYQSENVKDVTSSYLDINARLKSLNEKMDRLVELKANANDLDQLLKIEDQISDTQYQIENYTSQLNYLENQISYCTVEINLNEVQVYTEKPNFLTKIIDANKDSLEGFVEFLEGVCVLLVYLYPYLILFAGILSIVLYLHKRKKSKKINMNANTKANNSDKNCKNVKEKIKE